MLGFCLSAQITTPNSLACDRVGLPIDSMYNPLSVQFIVINFNHNMLIDNFGVSEIETKRWAHISYSKKCLWLLAFI